MDEEQPPQQSSSSSSTAGANIKNLVCTYSLHEMPKLIKTAAVQVGTRVEIYWPTQKRFFAATVCKEQCRKRENFLISYDTKSAAEREWIDLQRHKFRIIARSRHQQQQRRTPPPSPVSNSSCSNPNVVAKQYHQPTARHHCTVSTQHATTTNNTATDGISSKHPETITPVVDEDKHCLGHLERSCKYSPENATTKFTETIVLPHAETITLDDEVDEVGQNTVPSSTKNEIIPSNRLTTEFSIGNRQETVSPCHPETITLGIAESQLSLDQDRVQLQSEFISPDHGNTESVPAGLIDLRDSCTKNECIPQATPPRIEDQLHGSCHIEKNSQQHENAFSGVDSLPNTLMHGSRSPKLEDINTSPQKLSSCNIGTPYTQSNLSSIVLENAQVAHQQTKRDESILETPYSENVSGLPIRVVSSDIPGNDTVTLTKEQAASIPSKIIYHNDEKSFSLEIQRGHLRFAEPSGPKITHDEHPLVEKPSKESKQKQCFRDHLQEAETVDDDGVTIVPDDPTTRSMIASVIEVGSRVSVYWDDDHCYFPGTITKTKLNGKPFFLKYDDGDEEWIDLRKHKFRLLPSHEEGICSNHAIMEIKANDFDTDDESDLEDNPVPTARSKFTTANPRRKNSKLMAESPNVTWKVNKSSEPDSSDSENDDPPITRKTKPISNDSGNRNDISKISVGTRVAVWWPGDEEYYEATVLKERAHKLPFQIIYDEDKKVEWIDFRKHKFFLLSSPPEVKKRGRHADGEGIGASEDLKKISIGSRVAVWWSNVRKYYEGRVTRIQKGEKAFFLEYDDGKLSHWIDLSKHTFRLLDDLSPAGKTEARKRKNDESSQSKERKKEKKEKSSPRKKEDVDVTGTKKRKSSEVDRTPKPKFSAKDSDIAQHISVGTRVAVYWEGDSKYYNGVVTRERPNSKKRFYLEYDDGEAAHWIDFSNHWVEILSDQPTRKKNKTNAVDRTAQKCPSGRKKHSREESSKLSELTKVSVGSRISVWWSGDECYYKGTVVSQGGKKCKFRIAYDDGEKEWLDLSKQPFKLLPSSDSDDELSATRTSDSDSSDEDHYAYDDFVYGAVDNLKIGSRIAVWWPSEKKYFSGTLKKMDDDSRKPYFVKYDDGDEEWTDLRKRYFRFVN
jgi:hypothetical protein